MARIAEAQWNRVNDFTLAATVAFQGEQVEVRVELDETEPASLEEVVEFTKLLDTVADNLFEAFGEIDDELVSDGDLPPRGAHTAPRLRVTRLLFEDVLGIGVIAAVQGHDKEIQLDFDDAGDALGWRPLDHEESEGKESLTELDSAVREVTVRYPDGKTVRLEVPGNQYIYDVAEKKGIKLPGWDSCRAGACSSCCAKVLSGQVDQRDQSFLDDDQLEDGFVLGCVCYPLTDCELLVDQEDELY